MMIMMLLMFIGGIVCDRLLIPKIEEKLKSKYLEMKDKVKNQL